MYPVLHSYKHEGTSFCEVYRISYLIYLHEAKPFLRYKGEQKQISIKKKKKKGKKKKTWPGKNLPKKQCLLCTGQSHEKENIQASQTFGL